MISTSQPISLGITISVWAEWVSAYMSAYAAWTTQKVSSVFGFRRFSWRIFLCPTGLLAAGAWGCGLGFGLSYSGCRRPFLRVGVG
jgi:hypothetical protein